MKPSLILAALVLAATGTGLQADAVTDVQNQYRAQGAGPFQFDRGEALWNSHPIPDRQCASCHGTDLKQPGRHARTRKPIEPMAASVVHERYTDFATVEKWFKRNCTWTWGRECTPQEKGDLLEYLRRL